MPRLAKDTLDSKIKLPVEVSLSHLNQLLKTNISVIELGAKQKITSIRVVQFLPQCYAELYLNGRYEGYIDAKFNIKLNEEQQTFEFTNVDLKLRSKGIFAKGLNWLADSMFNDQIKDTLRDKCNEGISKLVLILTQENRSIPIPHNFNLNLEIDSFKYSNLLLEEKRLKLHLYSAGKISIISKEMS